MDRVKSAGKALLGFALIIALWQWGAAAAGIPEYILPLPSVIAQKFWVTLPVQMHHLGATAMTTLIGLALAVVVGVLLALAVIYVGALKAIILPALAAFDSIPKIAIAPLFIIWFGYGIQSKIVTVALIAFFPIIVNVIVGLETVDARRLLLMRALKGSAVQTYLKVRLPSMLPFLFAGLEMALIFSVIGAIVAEFIGASVGLGSVIIQRQATVDVAGVFSVLLHLSVMGIALNAILKLIARPFAFWARSKDIVSA
jgi:NitT/TauT family transport system permease protein